jgi:hypothetical protein
MFVLTESETDWAQNSIVKNATKLRYNFRLAFVMKNKRSVDTQLPSLLAEAPGPNNVVDIYQDIYKGKQLTLLTNLKEIETERERILQL